MTFKEKIQKWKCKLGLHKWNIRGWGAHRRFEICLADGCRKTKWVDDVEGCRKIKEESDYYYSEEGIRERKILNRERRLNKILNKLVD